jgi:hypothetical protein
MEIKKRVFVLFLVLCVSCVFTPQLWSTEVLYAPFECYTCIPQPKLTAVYVYTGGMLQPSACKFHNGLPPVLGKVGKAFETKNSHYIIVPDRPSINFGKTDFAITFWVKTTSTKSYNTILDKRQTHKSPGYHVVLYKGRPLLHICDGSQWKNYYGGADTVVNDGKWHYVAIYVDRDNTVGGKIYIDGICAHTFNPTYVTGSLNNNEKLFIGKHVDWSNAYFKGTLDELRLFRSASRRLKKVPTTKKGS